MRRKYYSNYDDLLDWSFLDLLYTYIYCPIAIGRQEVLSPLMSTRIMILFQVSTTNSFVLSTNEQAHKTYLIAITSYHITLWMNLFTL